MILKKFLMVSSLIRKCNIVIVILMLRELRKWKVFIISVFEWIKLKLGVRGNFGVLISNLNSKMQYQFEILRKCHFFPLDHDFF